MTFPDYGQKLKLPFEDGSFKTIYADPPWPESGGGRYGVQNHYKLLSISEIANMAPEIKRVAAESCSLYLWTTNNYLEKALRIMKHWGFTYKTTITWMKQTKGFGQYFRGSTEHCLFGRRGPTEYKYNEDGTRGQGSTGIFVPRLEHSQKPEQMREMIEKVSFPPYLELFARSVTVGWTAWGNEVEDLTKS